MSRLGDAFPTVACLPKDTCLDVMS
uniref:Uncharacterized protein n=1 Tax=Arundo donax TaxID=35708 RepID=A0A0A9FV68_ARUDO